MANHPSRNWRRVATEAAREFGPSWRFDAECASDAIFDFVRTDAQARAIQAHIEAAWLKGFEAGRASMRRPPE